jgi:hypothetical protein
VTSVRTTITLFWLIMAALMISCSKLTAGGAASDALSDGSRRRHRVITSGMNWRAPWTRSVADRRGLEAAAHTGAAAGLGDV